MIISWITSIFILALFGFAVDFHLGQLQARKNLEGRNVRGQFLPKTRKVIFYGDLIKGVSNND